MKPKIKQAFQISTYPLMPLWFLIPETEDDDD